jgi:hypothetical protein
MDDEVSNNRKVIAKNVSRNESVYADWLLERKAIPTVPCAFCVSFILSSVIRCEETAKEAIMGSRQIPI